MDKLTLTSAEKRALQSIHLRGYLGGCGSMTVGERRKLLIGLIHKGLLNDKCQVRKLGIELSSPQFN